MPQNPFYPPGVTERDISYPEPEKCPLCDGVGRIDCTPCCGSPYVEDAHGYHCFRCNTPYRFNTCTECNGEGVKE